MTVIPGPPTCSWTEREYPALEYDIDAGVAFYCRVAFLTLPGWPSFFVAAVHAAVMTRIRHTLVDSVQEAVTRVSLTDMGILQQLTESNVDEPFRFT